MQQNCPVVTVTDGSYSYWRWLQFSQNTFCIDVSEGKASPLNIDYTSWYLTSGMM